MIPKHILEAQIQHVLTFGQNFEDIFGRKGETGVREYFSEYAEDYAREGNCLYECICRDLGFEPDSALLTTQE